MTQSQTTLVAGPVPTPAPVCEFDIRRPLPNRPPVIFPLLEDKVRRHLYRHTIPSLWDDVARFLVFHGPKGTGKTYTISLAAAGFGWAVATIDCSELAGESEGAPSQRLNAYLAQLSAWSKYHRIMTVAVLDDLELSILSLADKTGHTVNSALLAKLLQGLADPPKAHRNFNGAPIPLIFSTNDLTKVRKSIFRDKRADHHKHQPTVDETLDAVLALFQSPSRPEAKLLEKAVRYYPHQPIAFWAAIKVELLDSRIDDLIQKCASVTTAQEILSKPEPIDERVLWATAKARNAQTITTHLS